MQELIAALRSAQAFLAERRVDEILAALDRVVDRWLDRGDPIRREAEERLAAGTGLAPAMLARGLSQMVGRVRGIGALLDQDLGSRYMLDRFTERAAGLRSRAFGPGLLVCIFSGNVPGIPAFDMALTLALKSACLARPASAEPVFAELFARSVAEVDPHLGSCLAVRRWGYDETLPLESAGAVLAYGSDRSLAEIRRGVPPGVTFLGHGHKVGFAVVAREAATAETARLLALDVAMYDQQGCVSPHAAYVEEGGPISPEAFARACGAALAELEGDMPRAPLDQADALALRSARDEAEFTADAVLGSPESLAWTVVHQGNPAFLPSPLNRVVRTYGISDLDEVVQVVVPQLAGLLQTVACAGPLDRLAPLAAALGRSGASRVCPVGRVQEPDPRWRHDGFPTAGSLVRWLDIEG